MKGTVRNALCIIVGSVVLWYAGAMFNFFPFMADNPTIRTVGFTGLLIALVIVICACWIIETIRKNCKEISITVIKEHGE